MTDEFGSEKLPLTGGGSPKKPQSPGATGQDANETAAPPQSSEGSVPAADCGSSKQPKSPGATESETDYTNITRGRSERLASFGALLSAFIASSGCWLPPLLILGGISGAGMVTFVQDYRPIFMFVTFAFLGSAFYLTYRPRHAGANGPNNDDNGSAVTAASPGSRIMKWNKVMLWCVTVIAAVFLFFPQTVTSLFASGDDVTADMEQTVISIEGMTGPTGAPKAERAIKAVPGVLAVNVDYDVKQATIGTEKGRDVPKAEILKALEKIKYRGAFIDQPLNAKGPGLQLLLGFVE